MNMAPKKRLKIDPDICSKQVSHSLSLERCLRDKIGEITSLNLTSQAENCAIEVFLVCPFGVQKVVEIASMVSSVKAVAIQKISENIEISTDSRERICLNYFQKYSFLIN